MKFEETEEWGSEEGCAELRVILEKWRGKELRHEVGCAKFKEHTENIKTTCLPIQKGQVVVIYKVYQRKPLSQTIQ